MTIKADYTSIRKIVRQLGLKRVGKDTEMKDGDLIIIKSPGHLVGMGIVSAGRLWTADGKHRKVYPIPLQKVSTGTIWRIK